MPESEELVETNPARQRIEERGFSKKTQNG